VASSSAGTGRLLILDDDSDIRTLVSEAANALSLEVTCVATTAEAVAAFREAQAEGRPFRVAMLDLTIRGESGGKQALRQLRALDPDLRAIVASGYSADPVLVDPGRHGFDAVLTKPFRLEELRAALNLALF
jgi:CheY-like chemotaxis protein